MAYSSARGRGIAAFTVAHTTGAGLASDATLMPGDFAVSAMTATSEAERNSAEAAVEGSEAGEGSEADAGKLTQVSSLDQPAKGPAACCRLFVFVRSNSHPIAVTEDEEGTYLCASGVVRRLVQIRCLRAPLPSAP